MEKYLARRECGIGWFNCLFPAKASLIGRSTFSIPIGGIKL